MMKVVAGAALCALKARVEYSQILNLGNIHCPGTIHSWNYALLLKNVACVERHGKRVKQI